MKWISTSWSLVAVWARVKWIAVTINHRGFAVAKRNFFLEPRETIKRKDREPRKKTAALFNTKTHILDKMRRVGNRQ